MDYMQVIEPAFHVVDASSQVYGSERSSSGMLDSNVSGKQNFFKNLSQGTTPGFLERMRLFRRPRILSARCLGGEMPAEAAG